MYHRAIRVVMLLAVASASMIQPASAAPEFVQPLINIRPFADVDVLIVPPVHGQIVNDNGVLNGFDPAEVTPFENSYLAAIENAVADVDKAIDAYGPQWLRDGLHINVKVLGRDTTDINEVRGAEILITDDVDKLVILGVSLWYSSTKCIVQNSKFFIESYGYVDMYNVSTHEYLHCLGLDHDYGVNGSPDVLYHDVMNEGYPHLPGMESPDLHCVSNLNVRGLEEAFRAAILNEPAQPATIPVSSYQRPTPPASGGRCPA